MDVIIDGVKFKPVESKTSFGIWVDSMYDNYMNEAEKYICVVDGLNGIVKLCCGKKSATAKCSSHDKFSIRVGIALAYARFNKLHIHSELMVKENNEKKFDVNRFRACLSNYCSASSCKRCKIKELAHLRGASNSCRDLIGDLSTPYDSYSSEYLKAIYNDLKDIGWDFDC